MWETLANIEGDTEFVDAQFQPGEEGLPQVKQGHGILFQFKALVRERTETGPWRWRWVGRRSRGERESRLSSW